MRDPERIDRICEKLKKFWKKVPDQRLGQVIENYIIPSGDMRGADTCWIFYYEDDGVEENLDALLSLKSDEVCDVDDKRRLVKVKREDLE